MPMVDSGSQQNLNIVKKLRPLPPPPVSHRFKKRILLVGGQAQRRQQLCKTIPAHEFDLDETGSAQKALSYLHGIKVDLVLADLDIPLREVHLLIEGIKKLRARNPVSLIFVLPEVDRFRHVLLEQISHYQLLRRPVSPDTLMDAIRQAIENPSCKNFPGH